MTRLNWVSTYVEDATNHPDNFLFVGEVEDFRDVLEHVELEILEVVQREVVVRQHPKARADVVDNLSVLLVLFRQAEQDLEAAFLHELFSENVDFEQVHQTVSVGLHRQGLGSAVLPCLDQIVQEV